MRHLGILATFLIIIFFQLLSVAETPVQVSHDWREKISEAKIRYQGYLLWQKQMKAWLDTSKFAKEISDLKEQRHSEQKQNEILRKKFIKEKEKLPPFDESKFMPFVYDQAMAEDRFTENLRKNYVIERNRTDETIERVAPIDPFVELSVYDEK